MWQREKRKPVVKIKHEFDLKFMENTVMKVVQVAAWSWMVVAFRIKWQASWNLSLPIIESGSNAAGSYFYLCQLYSVKV